jgi:hypothetical protein
MARDYYAEGLEIAKLLREAGLVEWADRLVKTIGQGYTATEILMGLRWELSQLLASDVEVEPATRAAAEELRDTIDSVLSN